MLGFLKKSPAKPVAKQSYKQIAVRPSTHRKLIEEADKRNRTIVDLVAEKVGA